MKQAIGRFLARDKGRGGGTIPEKFKGDPEKKEALISPENNESSAPPSPHLNPQPSPPKPPEKVPTSKSTSMLLTKYTGSCHCGMVTFEVVAPRKLPVYDCNCSICYKKQAKQFLIPSGRFQLLTGHNELTTYTFGTHQAKHLFCARCGVQSFFIPRSNPHVMAIMPHCLDGPLPLKIQTQTFDGRNYEEALKKSHIPHSDLKGPSPHVNFDLNQKNDNKK